MRSAHLDLLLNLIGQLTSRRQNQHERIATTTRRNLTILSELLDNGEQEGEGLALTGVGSTNKVLSLIDGIKCHSLGKSTEGQATNLDGEELGDSVRVEDSNGLGTDWITCERVNVVNISSIHRTSTDSLHWDLLPRYE